VTRIRLGVPCSRPLVSLTLQGVLVKQATQTRRSWPDAFNAAQSNGLCPGARATLPRFLDEVAGGRVVDGGSCRVLDDAPDAVGILRVFEVGKVEEVMDTPFDVERRADDWDVLASGRAGGGMSAESLLAVAFDRDAEERCMLSWLGKAGGMSSSMFMASSSSLAVASCVSSGAETDRVTVGSMKGAGEVGDCGDETCGDAGDATAGLTSISSLSVVVPNHQARRYEAISK
jgi:hypothetical protein